jgi:beta-glucosidase
MLQLKRLLVTAGFLINFVAGQDTVVHQDTHFYGQSPPIYPSPEISGTGGWNDAFSKAQALVLQMTLEEKTSLTGGYPNETSGCGGNIPAITRLGFPGMCLQDGPNGVRAADFVNGYPSGIHVGAR